MKQKELELSDCLYHILSPGLLNRVAIFPYVRTKIIGAVVYNYCRLSDNNNFSNMWCGRLRNEASAQNREGEREYLPILIDNNFNRDNDADHCLLV